MWKDGDKQGPHTHRKTKHTRFYFYLPQQGPQQ